MHWVEAEAEAEADVASQAHVVVELGDIIQAEAICWTCTVGLKLRTDRA